MKLHFAETQNVFTLRNLGLFSFLGDKPTIKIDGTEPSDIAEVVALVHPADRVYSAPVSKPMHETILQGKPLFRNRKERRKALQEEYKRVQRQSAAIAAYKEATGKTVAMPTADTTPDQPWPLSDNQGQGGYGVQLINRDGQAVNVDACGRYAIYAEPSKSVGTIESDMINRGLRIEAVERHAGHINMLIDQAKHREELNANNAVLNKSQKAPMARSNPAMNSTGRDGSSMDKKGRIPKLAEQTTRINIAQRGANTKNAVQMTKLVRGYPVEMYHF